LSANAIDLDVKLSSKSCNRNR